MSARDHHQSQSLGESTDGASGFVTKASLVFTTVANKAYAVIARCALRPISTNVAIATFFETSESAIPGDNGVGNEVNVDPVADDNWVGCQWVQIVPASASPVEWTFLLRFAGFNTDTATFQDCGIRGATILAIELSDQDQWAAGSGGGIGTSFTNLASKTWTPATAGAFWVLANTQVGGTGEGEYQIEHSTDVYSLSRKSGHGGTGAGATYAAMKRLDLPASSQTVNLQGKSIGSSGASVSNSPIILILREDQFVFTDYVEEQARAGTTSAGWPVRITLETELTAGDYLVLGLCIADEFTFGTTGGKAAGQLRDDDDTIFHNECQVRTKAASANDKYPVPCHFIGTFAAETKTWTMRWRTTSATAPPGNKGIQAASILVAKLEFPPPVNDTYIRGAFIRGEFVR